MSIFEQSFVIINHVLMSWQYTDFIHTVLSSQSCSQRCDVGLGTYVISFIPTIESVGTLQMLQLLRRILIGYLYERISKNYHISKLLKVKVFVTRIFVFEIGRYQRLYNHAQNRSDYRNVVWRKCIFKAVLTCPPHYYFGALAILSAKNTCLFPITNRFLFSIPYVTNIVC